MRAKVEATIEDLYHVPDGYKGELIDGEIVMAPTGDIPGEVGLEITISLREHGRRTRSGRAIPDNVGFIIDQARRNVFSPDSSFFVGERTPRFIEGAPLFAAEVRSENDYGPAAERAMAAKRAKYFEVGTLVVWDVDVLSGKEEVVRVYRADDPDQPTVYRRGEIAEAEPAVPGWKMAVDDLFVNEEDE